MLINVASQTILNIVIFCICLIDVRASTIAQENIYIYIYIILGLTSIRAFIFVSKVSGLLARN